MKSSSRSYDRSSLELGLIKKPRLAQDPNDYQQQQQELITEYKRALSELTINSKPIINNLTIIAGENLRAAKTIAAIICGNILEIPSEQKLPSLYLLDSIVKNIGRDYIKYFAARLPEVFCKAYREVKPLVHPGMRRLFGTWRRVFPPQQLQLIEKELGFTTGINGSSSGMPRDDSQPHQPADSMHVNHKYLEARQCLQQPTRANGSADDIIPVEAEKSERAAIVGSGRSWADLSTKGTQKERLNERVRGKTISAAYGDPEYGSDLSRGSGFGLGITGEKFKEEGFDKSWYNSGNGKVLSQRNGLNIKQGFQSISQKTAKSDAYPQLAHSFANRSSTLIDRSWQDSEEEEYMWDDVNKVGKYQRASEDSDKSGLDNQLPRSRIIQELGLKADSEASSDSLSTEDKGQAFSGDQVSSTWLGGARHSASVQSTLDHPRGYETSFSGLSTATSSIGRKPFQSQKGSVHVGALSFGPAKTAKESRGPKIQPRETPAPPSSQSPMHQFPPSPSVSISNLNQVVSSLTMEYQRQAESHADPRISQFSRRSNLEPHNQFLQETLSKTSQSAHLANSQMPQTAMHNPLMSSPKEGNHVPFPQKVQQESPKSESSGYAQKSIVTQISGFADPPGTVPAILPGSESPGQTSMSSLLAAVMNSGVLGSKSSMATSLNSWDKGALSSQAGAEPPLPSGSPIQFLSSGPRMQPVSVANVQSDRNASTPNYSQRNVGPLLPPGPTTHVGSASSQASDVSNAAFNPFSKLLSSLVAKGLITASKEDSPTSTSSQTPPQTQIQSPPPASISSTPVVSGAVSLPIPFSSPNDELSLSKHDAKLPDALLQSTKEEIKNLAGFAFKPGVIRESHPGVISELLDDVPHQCGICGLRLKHRMQLDRHLEWHALRDPDGKLLHSERRWYLNSGEWITRIGSLPHCGISAGLVKGSKKLSECTEVMVPADEGQCICVLCGELFEDYYDETSDRWMFRGAVYMNNSSSENGTQSPIVHKNCISESSQDLTLTKDIKLELEA